MSDTDEVVKFVQNVTGTSHFRVEQDFGNGFVRLESSEAERRQAQQDICNVEDAVIELLRNARDAGASLIFVATWRSSNIRSICVIDNGSGIPEDLHQLVFEPRVTSKLDSFHRDRWGVHGRGMALFSIKVNFQNIAICSSIPSKGTAILGQADLLRLPEKSDQSSFPDIVTSSDGNMVFRGPRNINRTIAEFSLECHDECAVYLGSSAEIAATLYALGSRLLPLRERTFPKAMEEYALMLWPCLCSTPQHFADTCAKLGLDLSARTARRILEGEIQPVDSYVANWRRSLSPGQEIAISNKAKARSRSFKMSRTDLKSFQQAVGRAYEPLADAYYLDKTAEPHVQVRSNELIVRIPLRQNDT